MLDSGANSEVQPEWLVQFAQMGSVYATDRFGIQNPKVGLLSIGEEPGKGDQLRKDVFPLLEAARGINFIGNVEGRDLMKDHVDVVVTDGFTGNVVLKTLEGALRGVITALFDALGSDPANKPHTDALMPSLLSLYEMFDPDTYGGAILLGVDGVCIISHGSTSAKAMVNGIKIAQEMVTSGMVEQIRTAIAANA